MKPTSTVAQRTNHAAPLPEQQATLGLTAARQQIYIQSSNCGICLLLAPVLTSFYCLAALAHLVVILLSFIWKLATHDQSWRKMDKKRNSDDEICVMCLPSGGDMATVP